MYSKKNAKEKKNYKTHIGPKEIKVVTGLCRASFSYPNWPLQSRISKKPTSLLNPQPGW